VLEKIFCATIRFFQKGETSTDRVNFLNVFFSDIHMQALEMHKKSPEKLRGWCIYWLVLATFTVFERITDAFLFFLPLYHEAKVAFVVYLWHPKSQGALYIYDKFVAPTLSKHEGLIDRKIEETQAKVGTSYSRTRRWRTRTCKR